MAEDDKLIKAEVVEKTEDELLLLKRPLVEQIVRKMVGEGRDACVYATHAEVLIRKPVQELLGMWKEYVGPRPVFRVEAVMPKIVLETGQLQDPPSFTSSLAKKLNELEGDGYDLNQLQIIGKTIILIAKDKNKS